MVPQIETRYGVQLLAVIALSTWIGMAVTALVLRFQLRRADRRDIAAGAAADDDDIKILGHWFLSR